MAKTKQEPVIELAEAPPKPRENPVEIPVQVVKGRLKLDKDFDCVPDRDYWFANHGQNVTWLTFGNLEETPCTVTVAAAHPDYDPAVYELGPMSTYDIGPFAAAIYNDQQFNRVTFTVSGPVHVACKRLGV